MHIGEAIMQALKYETTVRDTYKQAAQATQDPLGQKLFGILAREEQDHIDYLEYKLREWNEKNTVTPQALTTNIPDRKKLEQLLEDKKPSHNPDKDVDLLRQAIEVEKETSDFYARMVEELDSVGQRFFEQFLTIENGHLMIVQAELDSLLGDGYWFDFAEFNLEKA
jgi:rubrerythrin